MVSGKFVATLFSLRERINLEILSETYLFEHHIKYLT